MTPEHQMKFFFQFDDLFKARRKSEHRISEGIFLEDTAVPVLWLLCQHLQDYLGFDSTFSFTAIQTSVRRVSGHGMHCIWHMPNATPEQNGYVRSAISFAQRMDYEPSTLKRSRFSPAYSTDIELGEIDVEYEPLPTVLSWQKSETAVSGFEVEHEGTHYVLYCDWQHRDVRGWTFTYYVYSQPPTTTGKPASAPLYVLKAYYNKRQPLLDTQWIGFGLEQIENRILSPLQMLTRGM